MVPPNVDLSSLNDELLRKSPEKNKEAKRNTKEFIIDRILAVAEENNLELKASNTKLKRMSKTELNALLGEMLEESIKVQMKEAVGATGTSDSVIALASLRMVHDMIAHGLEKGLNTYLPPYGYRVDGFTRSMKTPVTSKCIDECLKEIAAESDVLGYIKSPYARLAIAWTGSIMGSLRRVPVRNNNMDNKRHGPSPMESRSAPQQNPI